MKYINTTRFYFKPQQLSETQAKPYTENRGMKAES